MSDKFEKPITKTADKIYRTALSILLLFGSASLVSCRLGDNAISGQISNPSPGAPAGPDLVPDSFSFVNQDSVKQLYLTKSSTQQVSGIDSPVNLSISGSGGAPFELGEVQSYFEDSLSLAPFTSNGHAFEFSADGTKMYLLNANIGKVLQFSLRTPWNISSSTYDNISLDYSTEDTNVKDLRISTDGQHLYIVGRSSVKVHQYNLSSAWDLSTAQYDSQFFGVSTQDSLPTSIHFGDNGSKLYLFGSSTSRVYQYTLPTAWDVSSASYDSVNIDLSGYDIATGHISLKSDGSEFSFFGMWTMSLYTLALGSSWDLSSANPSASIFGVGFMGGGSVNSYTVSPNENYLYILGGGTSRSIFQYSLNVTGDIQSILVPDNKKALGLGALNANPQNIALSTDGSRLFMVGPGVIYQLDLSVPFDIRTAIYSGASLNVSGQDSGSASLTFKPDGSKLYVAGYSNDRVYQYTLGTPWNITTASYDSINFSIASQDGLPYGLAISSNGSKLYMLGRSNKAVFQYTLPTPWSLTGASYDSVSVPVSSIEFFPEGISLSSDGSKLYLTGESSDSIHSYTLATPWSLSTASLDTSVFSIATESDKSRDVVISSDGSQLYILDDDNLAVYQYTLQNAFDLTSTTNHDIRSASVLNPETNQRTLSMKPDGTKLYLLGASRKIHQYSLTTPGDLTTAVYDNVLVDVSAQASQPWSLKFNSDGSKMYILDAMFTQLVLQYSLPTPWDITSASYDAVAFDVGPEDINPRDMVFSSDGSKMWLLGMTSGSVFQYTLSPPWDLSSASYDSVYFDISNEVTSAYSMQITDSGRKMFVLGSNVVSQYNLADPWDITSSSYSGQSFTASIYSESMMHFEFSQDGNGLFFLGNTLDRIYKYSVGRGGDPEYRICTDAQCNEILYDWRSDSSGVVNNNNYIQLRLTSPGAASQTNTATINIGNYQTTWAVTTEP